MNTCMDCRKEIKPQSRQCAECYRKNRSHEPRQFFCIDCGKPVGRRIKRCPSCHKQFQQNMPTYERTEEHKAQMSLIIKNSETHQAYAESRQGVPIAPETIERRMEYWTPKRREEARQRGLQYAKDRDWIIGIAESLSGEKNPNWQGGIANIEYAPGFNKRLKRNIRKRDHFTCQLCGITEQELDYHLTVHHIDYSKDNHSQSNLITLCKRCNSFVNFARKFWTQWFRARLANSVKT